MKLPINQQSNFKDLQFKDTISLSQRTWFTDWINDDTYPCVMSKAVIKAENFVVNDYKNHEIENINQLSRDLEIYLKQYSYLKRNEFASFIAVFSQQHIETELAFEDRLWNVLFNLSLIDPKEWDSTVDRDYTSINFSFSHRGTAFYIVGMHPNSSRKARQTPYFSIVFNIHEQFEDLRTMGAYYSVRDRIRDRDKVYSGSVNPMVDDFGTSSEAIQYSGRAVDKETWKCPYFKKED